MQKRKTAKIVMGIQPENNKFKDAKVTQFLTHKNHAKQSEKAGIDFEQFLWDNASGEFYDALKKAMNSR